MNLEASEDKILAEIRYRNPILKDHLKSMKIVYRHKDTNEGHVKLWLTSKTVKDELLKRAEIFLPTRRCRVTQPDLNREIRRCFKCQMYGHLLIRTEKPLEMSAGDVPVHFARVHTPFQTRSNSNASTP
jgi:hypothetical protein